MSIEYRPTPIAALASAPGAAGVCVVRVSGEGALQLGDSLLSGETPRRLPSQREGGTFFHTAIFHPKTHEMIDDGVMLIYRAPHSYTGEDTLEIQGHGGSVPARRLLEAVLAAGARLAEPGEFTKRAFLNGKMDLTQAEAICDFIQSKTDRVAQIARTQMSGRLGQTVDVFYQRLVEVCSEIEHALDFQEDELPGTFIPSCHERLSGLLSEMGRLAETVHTGHILRDGALVVISGRPNAGKSSLLNALLETGRAIVHDTPGTTRDAIEESYALKGIPLRLVDTAGLRETHDVIEQEGICRAWAFMRQADLNIHLIDGSVPFEGWNAQKELFSPSFVPERMIIVLTKRDRCGASPDVVAGFPQGVPCIRVSSLTGEGLSDLKESIVSFLGVETEAQGQQMVSVRQFSEIRQAINATQEAVAVLLSGPEQLVITAGLLHQAAESLGRLVGHVYSDDLLDRIFSRFCVGK